MKIKISLFYMIMGLMTIILGLLTTDGYLNVEEVTVTEVYGMCIAFFGYTVMTMGVDCYYYGKIYDRIRKEEAAREADKNTTNHRLNCHVELLTNRVESLERKVNNKDP